MLEVQAKDEDDRAVALAETVIRPTVQAAATLRQYRGLDTDVDLMGLISALRTQTDAAVSGDMGRAEAMLITQAHTLDAIFNNLARRANSAEYMDNFATYLKLALRAQSQCRSTLEALSAIKYPPVAGYVKQANIAHGPQQVNNGPLEQISRARENQIQQTELLEKSDGEWLDTGAASTTSGLNPAMTTVEEIDRPEDAGGKM